MRISVNEAVQRAAQLEVQLEAVRQEVVRLRRDLERLNDQVPLTGTVDSLSAAVALAQDLGPGFSSERPHDVSERGDNWFEHS